LKDGVREIADLLLAGVISDPAQAQYDNHRGLLAAVTEGRVGALRSPECQRYGAEYGALWGRL
jgi:hypothetical protein